jgi:heterodisulfide reductase subunit B
MKIFTNVTNEDRVRLFAKNLSEYIVVASMSGCYYCSKLLTTLSKMDSEDLKTPIADINIRVCRKYAEERKINAFPEMYKHRVGVDGSETVTRYTGNRTPISIRNFVHGKGDEEGV